VKHLQARSLTLFFFLSLAVAGLALHQANRLQPAQALAMYLFSPLQNGLTALTTTFNDATQTLRDMGELRHRNQELQRLVDHAMIENVRLREIEAEHEALLNLLDFTRANPSYEYKAAAIIGRDPSNLLGYIFIDVGANDGVQPDMPVVTERGLVGRIAAVGPDSCKVLLITDPSSSVNALLQGSRTTGMVEGRLGGDLIMKYIPQEEKIEEGDMVITSGLGGNFPKRVVIGQVVKIRQLDIESFQSAEVHPTVDFDHLEIVLVITNFDKIDFLNRDWEGLDRE
jgi:rod shape-determining protein MreC